MTRGDFYESLHKPGPCQVISFHVQTEKGRDQCFPVKKTDLWEDTSIIQRKVMGLTTLLAHVLQKSPHGEFCVQGSPVHLMEMKQGGIACSGLSYMIMSTNDGFRWGAQSSLDLRTDFKPLRDSPVFTGYTGLRRESRERWGGSWGKPYSALLQVSASEAM